MDENGNYVAKKILIEKKSKRFGHQFLNHPVDDNSYRYSSQHLLGAIVSETTTHVNLNTRYLYDNLPDLYDRLFGRGTIREIKTMPREEFEGLLEERYMRRDSTKLLDFDELERVGLIKKGSVWEERHQCDCEFHRQYLGEFHQEDAMFPRGLLLQAVVGQQEGDILLLDATKLYRDLPVVYDEICRGITDELLVPVPRKKVEELIARKKDD